MTKMLEKAREAAADIARWEAFTPADDDGWYFITKDGIDAILRLSEVVAALAAKGEA